jgi:hypothetical protein
VRQTEGLRRHQIHRSPVTTLTRGLAENSRVRGAGTEGAAGGLTEGLTGGLSTMSLTNSDLNPGTRSLSTRTPSPSHTFSAGGTFGRSARLSAAAGSRRKETRKPLQHEPLALSLSGLTVSSRMLGGGRNEQEQAVTQATSRIPAGPVFQIPVVPLTSE